MASRCENLADAFEAVAKADHYLVDISGEFSFAEDEVDIAEQLLIARQNAEDDGSARWSTLDLALDLLESYRKVKP